MMNVRVSSCCKVFVITLFCLSIFALAKPFTAHADWNGNPYAAGQTLNPECGPTDENCVVVGTPWQTTDTSTSTSLDVGIGTTTPQYKLDVNGDINFTGNLYKNGTAFVGGVLSINDSNAIWSSNTSQPTDNSVLSLGDHAGYGANGNSQKSNFIGYYAGNDATNAYNANFIGVNAGDGATYADKSNFIGHRAGNGATNAGYSNFLGRYAGYVATGAYRSNFIGNMAGYAATNAFNSTFIGERAGYGATYASNAIFIGDYAGNNDAVNNNGGGTSIAIGKYSGTGGFSNSIAIGHGVVNNAADQFNIGNVLYGTGIYASDYQSAAPTEGGSIGIGTSTPQATLDVFGSAILSGINSYFNFGSNGAGSSGYGFRDNNGVMQYKNAGDGDWSNVGSGAVSGWQNGDGNLTYSGGNIGIGTTDPTSLLYVKTSQAGQIPMATFESNYSNEDQGPSIDFRDTNVTTNMIPDPAARIQVLAVSPGGAGLGFYYNQGLFGMSHTLTEAMRISGYNGYVGIGTTDHLHLLELPNAFVDTDGSASFANNAFNISNTGNLTFAANAPAYIGVESANSQGMYGGDLTISAGAATGGYNGGGSLILKAGNAFTGTGESAGDVRLYAGANNYTEGSVLGNIIFYKGELNGLYTEAMRMNADGKFGIGTASPTSALTVNYDEGSFSNGGLTVLNTDAGNWPSYISLGNPAVMSSISAGNGSDTVLIQAGNSGGVALGFGDTSWHAASDERLKKNIQDLNAPTILDKVLALNPVTFNWIDPKMSTTTQYGFIAQDVLKLFPELVSKPADPSKCVPGNAINNCYGVSYDRFGVLAIAAIKDVAGITGTFKNNLIAWFGDATNGIQKLFVKEVHTNKICVAKSDGTEVCVTGDELQKLVSTPTGTTTTAAPSESAPTNTETPAVVSPEIQSPSVPEQTVAVPSESAPTDITTESSAVTSPDVQSPTGTTTDSQTN